MTAHTDAVVVGGGLAGLTAATRLARAGCRVMVCERSSTLGGRAATQTVKGFRLNLGPHAWYPTGPGTAILRDLGVTVTGQPPSQRGALAVDGGRLHTLPVGLPSLLATSLLDTRGKFETARLLARLPRLQTAALDDMTLDAWLDAEVSHPVVRRLLATVVRVAAYADAPDLLSAGAGLASLQAVLRDNVVYVDHGWSTIVEALAARATAAGVEIITSAPVESVAHDARVRGVALESGRLVSAHAVIVTGSPATVRALVSDVGEHVTGRWVPTPARAACLDLALRALPNPAVRAAFGLDRPLYYGVHSMAANLAPPSGGAVVHVAKYLYPGHPSAGAVDEQELEGLLDELQSGWRSHVIEKRYLPSMTVANGIPLARDGGLAGRPPVEVAGVDGLFVAGDWVGPSGMLAHAAIASGAAAATLAARRVNEAAA